MTRFRFWPVCTYNGVGAPVLPRVTGDVCRAGDYTRYGDRYG